MHCLVKKIKKSQIFNFSNMSKDIKITKGEQIKFVIILILSHVIIIDVVVIPVSLIPIPVIGVLAGLIHWLDS